MENEIELFDSVEIRKVKLQGEWWISSVDAARAIGYSNPNRDASNILNENKNRFENYSTVTKLVSIEKGKNGTERSVSRNITVLNLKGVIAFCMFSKLEKAIPFQRWADKVLAEHIVASVNARNKKYGEITDKSIERRNFETKQWKRHGIEAPKDYRELTLYEYELLGMKDKRKEQMNSAEWLELMVSNDINAFRLQQKKDMIFKDGIQKEMENTAKYIESIKQIG